MLYGLIPLVASVALGIRYLADEEASSGSKVAVAGIVAAGLLIWWRYPQWLAAAIVLQSAISIYVLIYLKMHAV
jgi:hypothetical protein